MKSGTHMTDEWYDKPFIREFISFCYKTPTNKKEWLKSYRVFKEEHDRIYRIYK